MKLPKSLLAAIIIGIALQTTTSCSKDIPEPKKKEIKIFPDNCPACGMG